MNQTGRSLSPLTQLLPGKLQAGGVLVQVLAEVNTQVAELLLDRFHFLEKKSICQ